MDARDSTHSWFDPLQMESGRESPDDRLELQRLWVGFMTARVTLGLVLLLLQGSLYALGHATSLWLVVFCGGYFAATLVVRVTSQPHRLGNNFDLQWLMTTGVDVLAFTALQFLHGSSINYTPLYALPVLLAAVLGSLPLAMGTAASVTLLLLAQSAWLSWHGPAEVAQHFIQAALTGAGIFVIAFLTNQIAVRLASLQQRARRNQDAMRLQQQVNDLVIDSLSDGILVVDAHSNVHAANPAARQMLQVDERPIRSTPISLLAEPGWQPLAELAFQIFAGRGDFHRAEIDIQHAGQGHRRLRLRTRMTATHWGSTESLCVMFLQDLREMEARMRTEKLASMGRMSAAVAHEIRNPLAAIAQANALLDEELSEPRHHRLTQMIQQNAKRLGKIVDEVLNISRVGPQPAAFETQVVALNEAVTRICRDWARQNNSTPQLRINLPDAQVQVAFEPEHLRRVLVNLLDNARRYASKQAESIQVWTHRAPGGEIVLGVWSDSPPMEQSVAQHLFEPFFSSESRSSGLGLYICREMCEGHGATISYQRARRIARGTPMDGNEFFVNFRPARAARGSQPRVNRPHQPWQ